MSSVNNSSQANSEIASTVPHVQFATPKATWAMTCAGSPVEAPPTPSMSNPDGHCHHHHHQQASRRFQHAVMVVDHVHWGLPTKGSSGLVDTQGRLEIT